MSATGQVNEFRALAAYRKANEDKEKLRIKTDEIQKINPNTPRKFCEQIARRLINQGK